METAKGATNMALAHEIMVNQDFEVKPSELPEGRYGLNYQAWQSSRCLLFTWIFFFYCFRMKTNILCPNSLEHMVKEMMHKAFWDSLEAELKQDPPTYEHAIKLLGEIKEVRI